jgi:hypothetical protein
VGVSRTVKKLVIVRSGARCEYCRVPDYLSAFNYHIEHVVPLQHKGTDELDNLAYSCAPCNLKKGTNIGTLLRLDGPVVRLFNPRNQHWFDHFRVFEGRIEPLTDTGLATINLLDLNHPSKVMERAALQSAGFYP